MNPPSGNSKSVAILMMAASLTLAATAGLPSKTGGGGIFGESGLGKDDDRSALISRRSLLSPSPGGSAAHLSIIDDQCRRKTG